MAVYKKGYICWTLYTDYRPELFEEYRAGRIPYEKVRSPRQEEFKIGRGMVIKLRSWKKEYSEAAALDHAKFCDNVEGGVSSALFMDAIRPEILLLKKDKK